MADSQHYIFSELFAVASRSLAFVAKSAAKVLLFFGLTKFLSNFFNKTLHFLCKWLILSITFFRTLRYSLALTCVCCEIGCKGTAFWWIDQILEREICANEIFAKLRWQNMLKNMFTRIIYNRYARVRV